MQATNGNIEKDGYFVTGPVISDAECDYYSVLVDKLDGNSRALLNETWCRVLSENLLCKLASIIPEVRCYCSVQCTLFRKNINNNWLVALHQDKSLPYDSQYDQDYYKKTRVKDGLRLFQPPEDILKKVLAIRLSLDANHENNGPLRILAGTHNMEILDPDAIDVERANAHEIAPIIDRGWVTLY